MTLRAKHPKRTPVGQATAKPAPNPPNPETEPTEIKPQKSMSDIATDIEAQLAKDIADLQVQAARLGLVRDYIRVFIEDSPTRLPRQESRMFA